VVALVVFVVFFLLFLSFLIRILASSFFVDLGG